jgi:serine/threonine-protein kinase
MTRDRLRALAALVGGALGAFLIGIVALNAVVGLLVRQGHDLEVPDLAGITVRDAERRLAPAGLSVSVKSERPSAHFEAGRIVSQHPKPLARVRRGRRIEVIVSTGIDAASVPLLEGLTLREASFRLLEDGLSPGDSVAVPFREVPEGRVLATAPPPGAPVSRGGRVDLLVSQGPRREAFAMPDLTNRDIDDVAARIRDAGFALGIVRTEKDRRVPRGTVVGQFPPPGSRVVSGQSIDLDVAAR